MTSEAHSAYPSYLAYLQARARGVLPPPIGVVYNTSMSRPDAALGLASLYLMESKREARVGAVCVTGGGLDTAIYCDIIGRFYSGPAKNGNQQLAIGLPAINPLPPDPPMVKAAVDRKKPGGDPQYLRSIRKLSDTSQADAVLRNGIVFNAETVVVLSAPATWLAKSIDLAGNKEQYTARVKRFVIVDTGEPVKDPAALRKVFADSPVPIVLCGRDVGEALPFSAAAAETAFAPTTPHPVGDAYRAFKPAPYAVPMHDVAALHYAVHPESGFFTLSGPGTVKVSDDGRLTFVEGTGTVRKLAIDPARRDQALASLVALASGVPNVPAPRGRGGASTSLGAGGGR